MGGIVDYFALALSHGLLLLMAWRLMQRADLDHEEVDGESTPPPSQAAARGARRG